MKEIEYLKQQRQIEIERAGKAMKDALEIEQRALEEKREKNERAIKAHQAAK